MKIVETERSDHRRKNAGICCARSFLLDGALFWNFKRRSNNGNPTCRSMTKKKLKNTSDDEMKLAGLEALVHEELEKHLILNLNRLQTFEDARLEIVTYGERRNLV